MAKNLPRAVVIARTLGCVRRCEETNNAEWLERHSERLAELLAAMPSGSGVDSGTTLNDESTPERLVFETSFHHMNDGGMYDGWTEHTVIVSASLELGLRIRITGRDRNDIKEYLVEMFHSILSEEIPEYTSEPKTAETT